MTTHSTAIFRDACTAVECLIGERRPLAEFWKPGRPLIEPLTIPPFTPRRWRRRAEPLVL